MTETEPQPIHSNKSESIEGHLLFLTITPIQLEFEARLAAAARERLGMESIAAVHGDKLAKRALELGFDEAVNLSIAPHAKRLGRTQVEELRAAFHSFDMEMDGRPMREAILQDRWLNDRFEEGWTLTYLNHVRHVTEDLLRRRNVALCVGEVNYAAFRLIRRILENRGVPFCLVYSNALDGRFRLDPSFYAEDIRAQEMYEMYLREGIPSEDRRAAVDILSRIEKRLSPSHTEQARTVRGLGELTLLDKLRSGAVKRSLDVWLGRRDMESGYPVSQKPSEAAPWSGLKRTILGWASRKTYDRLVSRSHLRTPYALFFLHQSPEYTLETQGWPWRDQAFLIQRISEALPYGMQLAVKEHVHMRGRRNPDLYTEMSQGCDIVFLPAKMRSIDLIQNASCVFTISGTSALEAMALGVPAITFSPVIQSNFRGVVRCQDLLELPEMVRMALDGSHRPATREEVLAAFAAMHATSQPAIAYSGTIPESMTEENVRRLCKGFVREVRTICGNRVAEVPVPEPGA